MTGFLKALNTRGILCGPFESCKDLQRRAGVLELIKKNPQLLNSAKSFDSVSFHEPMRYRELDLEISWLPCCFSTKKLSPWEPAAIWLMECEQIILPLLQMKPDIKRLKKDITKHEMVHAARSAFDEPVYEEFLAYATFPSRWRKGLGPLFRSSKESMVFVLLSALPLLEVFLPLQIGLLFIPILSFMMILFMRLSLHTRIFKRMLRTIKQIFEVEAPLQVALRLSDQEIRLFGVCSLEEVTQYIFEQHCTRWHQILSSYKLRSK